VLLDVDPLQLLVVRLPLAGMGTDNRDIASIEGILILVAWVGGKRDRKKINNLLWQEILGTRHTNTRVRPFEIADDDGLTPVGFQIEVRRPSALVTSRSSHQGE
jgi:hypothetical protein